MVWDMKTLEDETAERMGHDGTALKRILVVDDEVAYLVALKSVLSPLGLVIDTAETIEDAFNYIESFRYNAVIADIRLTGVLRKEGIVLLEKAKRQQPTSGVIMITGFGSPDVMQEAYELGADYYFEKPVPLKNIKTALRELGVLKG